MVLSPLLFSGMIAFHEISEVTLTPFYRLSDHDDDVRAVAANCLLPIAGHLVEYLPDSLDQVLIVLWQCLNDMKDDLNCSVGAVMDLLGMPFFKELPLVSHC